MLGLFKKRRRQSEGVDSTALVKAASNDIKEKWIHFNNTMHYKAEVTLAERIEAFGEPVSLFYRDHHPLLFALGPDVFWIIVYGAIRDSGTHPPDLVNAAVAQVRANYGSHQ